MIGAGPLVLATWSIPAALASALTAAGRPIPPPVSGAMVLDTGATFTSISSEAAADLGLQAIRVAKTHGAGGVHENFVYEATIQIAIRDALGNQTVVGNQMQVMGIPDLGKSLPGLQFGDQPIKVIGLLGRDFLRHATLVYDGARGHFRVTINRASIRTWIAQVPGAAPPGGT